MNGAAQRSTMLPMTAVDCTAREAQASITSERLGAARWGLASPHQLVALGMCAAREHEVSPIGHKFCDALLHVSKAAMHIAAR